MPLLAASTTMGYSPICLARIGAWQPESNDGETQHSKYLGEFQRQMRAPELCFDRLEKCCCFRLIKHLIYTAAGERMPAAPQRALAEYARQGGKLTLLGTTTMNLAGLMSFMKRSHSPEQVDVDAESAWPPHNVSVLKEADGIRRVASPSRPSL